MTFTRLMFAVFLGISLFLASAICRSAQGDDAKELYSRGIALYEQNHYKAAAEAFREAYRLRPSWKIQFNIGQCEASITRYGLAIQAFEAYLVGGGDDVPAERRDFVLAELDRLQHLVGRLDVTAPEGLTVVVDGEARATTPLEGPVRIAAGKHEVELRQDEETVYSRSAKIAGGMTTSVRYDPDKSEPEPEGPATPTLESAAPSESVDATPTDTTPDTPEPPPSRLVPFGWAALGTGLAVAAAGVVTGALAIKNANTLEDKCSEPDACPDDNRKYKTSADKQSMATNVLLPVGGVVAATGLVLVILGKRQEKREPAVSVVPGGGLMIEGRF